MASSAHQSVLLDEAVDALCVRPDGLYVDCTYGRGGHSSLVMEKLGPGGRLLALDRDPAAIADADQRFATESRFEIVRSPFSALRSVLEERGLMGELAGVLLDIGVSSPQLDEADRGFSFMRDGPLDMRMDPEAGPSAAAWLATVEPAELARVLKEYGEERFAKRIASAIVARRQERAITTTADLAGIIENAMPRREPGQHPATRSFQAIRIHINRELDELDSVLSQAVDSLAPQGRCVVISFHSLEDRRVKRYFRDRAKGPSIPRGLPLPEHMRERTDVIQIGKAVRATAAESEANPRARSAIMRVVEKR